MSYEAWGEPEDDGEQEYRCPECGSADVHVGTNWGQCYVCRIGAFAETFEVDMDDLAASRAAEQAEADAEHIGSFDHD